MFSGRKLVIATKHGKEQVIAPLLEDALGVICVPAGSLDTDQLGTFTGEVERTLDPLATAREKCRLAMAETGADLAVASEGSFGPHPAVFLMPADDEILVLVDQRHDSEFVVREVSSATNFSAADISTEAALLAFAKEARFPSHGLILRRSPESSADIHKGIIDPSDLRRTFALLKSKYETITVETDMRANYNPSRMAVIEAAARKLVALLQSVCPACGAPGFSVTEVKRGLPCGACGLPTESASRHISVCKHCGHCEELRFPHGKTVEDPMYCEYCNP